MVVVTTYHKLAMHFLRLPHSVRYGYFVHTVQFSLILVLSHSNRLMVSGCRLLSLFLQFWHFWKIFNIQYNKMSKVNSALWALIWAPRVRRGKLLTQFYPQLVRIKNGLCSSISHHVTILMLTQLTGMQNLAVTLIHICTQRTIMHDNVCEILFHK